ncbi:MAG TPA: phosphate ABC transporter ATP-binding protein PstB [Ignavibacteria bacterium]|nr:phosphate ABC transporter ATP-binding protein PstB [Ignavibacteria bacterium]
MSAEIIKEEEEKEIIEEPQVETEPEGKPDSKFSVITENLSVYFNETPAIKDINIKIRQKSVTAIIGPSGCGKSTFLRSLNMMHELNPKARMTGTIKINGKIITDYNTIDLRKKVGMLFQKPNPFPTMSIYDNVISGIKYTNGKSKSFYDERVEKCLVLAGLWNEVKDRLKVSAMTLSGGQQQRLCIARSIAVNPDIILMDEPTSALDPMSTLKVEELIYKMKNDYTIIIVTHNMQQAARVSDHTAFFFMGKLVEYSKTRTIFTNPKEKLTEEYVTGKFG